MDEVKAAVERLRNHEGTAFYSYCYEDGEECEGSYMADLQTLADAYLAEHPADEDEAITEDWLRSVGGTQGDNPIKWTFYRNDAMPIGLWHVDYGWKVMLIHAPHTASCIVRGLRTRGDVRRLMACLKGAPDGEASEA